MAGIAGMGTPSRVAPDVPQDVPVAAAQLPPMQVPAQQSSAAPAVDLDALYAEAAKAAPAQAPSASGVDLDALYQEAAQQAKPEEHSFLNDLGHEVAHRIGPWGGSSNEDKARQERLGGAAAKGVGVVANVLDRMGPAEVRGATGALIDKHQGKEDSSVIDGVINGALDPSKVPSGSALVEKVAPATAKPVNPLKSALLDNLAKENLSPKEYADYQKLSAKTEFKPSTVLGVGVDVASSVGVNAMARGAGKLVGLATGAAMELAEGSKDAIQAVKVAGKLDPVRRSEVYAQSLDDMTTQLEQAKTKIPLMPNQMDLTNAREQEIAASISNNAAIQAVKRKQGDMATQAILENANSYANIEPKAGGAKGAFDTLHEAADAQGRIIRAHRDMAKDMAGEAALPINNLQTKMKEYADQAGFARQGDKLVIPSADDVAVNLNISPDDAKNIIPFLQRYSERVYNSGGRMKFGDLDQFYQKDLTLFAKQLAKTNSTAQHIAFDLRGAAGEDMTTNIGTLLKDNPTASAEYGKAMEAFSRTKQSGEKIKGILKRDDMTADNMANALIAKGPAGADSTNAIVDILSRENPEALRDLRGAAMNKMFYANKNMPTAKNPLPYDFKGIKNDIDKIAGTDGKMLDALTGSADNSKALRELVDRAAQMHEGIGSNSPVINESAMGRMLYLASKINAPKELVGSLIKIPGRSYQIERYLNTAGMQDLIKYAPPAYRPTMLNYVRSLGNSLSEDSEKELPQGYQKQGQ